MFVKSYLGFICWIYQGEFCPKPKYEMGMGNGVFVRVFNIKSYCYARLIVEFVSVRR